MSTPSLTAETHLRLRNDIIQGRIRPNERLVALELAERLQVSRTPVREALQLLASQGLVVPVKRGYVVREHTPEEIAEIYEIRSALEELAARLAAQRATPDQLRAIEDIGAHQSGALDDDRTVIVDRNDAFHEAILQASGNSRLAELNRANSEQFFTYRVAQLYTRHEAAAAIDEHAQILEALKRRDSTRAAELARSHVLGAMAITLSKIL
ncbi:GntR family transcriptional regulator [Microbacterium trichothecenolyticum]|uniref:GntR family transcriptional regulator n=1 Tax=Microbacterium ureisolvens TaxID=2781186 RepID=A0ABS7I3Q1_9MICO|nr:MULTISPECIES: GntR family transcriptional regulator [Microbacterium]MBW9111895.1 GntR family transcriptional regulator [Microbacterium ureisolvens]MBW9122258.1 GntR family transcriptional regulator [Microbacterium trichothecenolyticum]